VQRSSLSLNASSPDIAYHPTADEFSAGSASRTAQASRSLLEIEVVTSGLRCTPSPKVQLLEHCNSVIITVNVYPLHSKQLRIAWKKLPLPHKTRPRPRKCHDMAPHHGPFHVHSPACTSQIRTSASRSFRSKGWQTHPGDDSVRRWVVAIVDPSAFDDCPAVGRDEDP
jgi:hypothetical protein